MRALFLIRQQELQQIYYEYKIYCIESVSRSQRIEGNDINDTKQHQHHHHYCLTWFKKNFWYRVSWCTFSITYRTLLFTNTHSHTIVICFVQQQQKPRDRRERKKKQIRGDIVVMLNIVGSLEILKWEIFEKALNIQKSWF